MLNDSLFESIMRHLTHIDKVNHLSLRMLKHALSGEADAVYSQVENRTRLINIVEKFQKEVEKKIENLMPSQVDSDLLEILRAWTNDVEKWVALTDEIDTETSKVLEQLKDQTAQEIGNLYRSRTQFKGYNLNSVKK